ncbi:VOC family protein [Capnocytophaga sp.]|uniref:VOC family protein n=1 Tax=Capnocytophaga sp. TaxID=44737 RepID=UPI0026DB4A6E|nr:VOC family protein [Capnocytophaga sp.]MDO5104530.1 VOC family protein [Capnocytophaga sp.]
MKNIKKIYACWAYVSDLEASKNFFESLGFVSKFRQDDWIEFDLGATSFAILKRPPEKGNVVPQKTRIMFEVEDIKRMFSTLVANNVRIIGDIRDEHYGKLLTFEDLDGNWFEFFENKSKR